MDELQRASLILEALGQEPPMPPNWRRDLILLLRATELPPTRCCDIIKERAPAHCAFSWTSVLAYIERAGDKELGDLIRCARAAYFERQLEGTAAHPLHHSLITMGINLFTDHKDKEAQANLTVNVIQELREERKRYIEALQQADEREALQLEVQRIGDCGESDNLIGADS